jgi:hypothetical protein
VIGITARLTVADRPLCRIPPSGGSIFPSVGNIPQPFDGYYALRGFCYARTPGGYAGAGATARGGECRAGECDRERERHFQARDRSQVLRLGNLLILWSGELLAIRKVQTRRCFLIELALVVLFAEHILRDQDPAKIRVPLLDGGNREALSQLTPIVVGEVYSIVFNPVGAAPDAPVTHEGLHRVQSSIVDKSSIGQKLNRISAVKVRSRKSRSIAATNWNVVVGLRVSSAVVACDGPMVGGRPLPLDLDPIAVHSVLANGRPSGLIPNAPSVQALLGKILRHHPFRAEYQEVVIHAWRNVVGGGLIPESDIDSVHHAGRKRMCRRVLSRRRFPAPSVVGRGGRLGRGYG